jgi:hypothetical protein
MSAAMKKGERSFSKTRGLSRIATPDNEGKLLEIARTRTAHHVDQVVRRFRRPEAEELSREEQQQAGRLLAHFYDDGDGSLVVNARLPAESGALLVKALDAAVGELKSREPTEPTEGAVPQTSWLVKQSDALSVIVEGFLRGAQGEVSGGERSLLVLHVDEATLREGREGRCWLEDGRAIAVETARRFGCDSSVMVLVEDERSEALDVGRKTRTIPAGMRRALEARDGKCRFPGCTNTHIRNLEGHHIKHWAEGGDTKLENLILTCWHRHRCLHEGGFKVKVLEDGGIRFFAPDGRVFG